MTKLYQFGWRALVFLSLIAGCSNSKANAQNVYLTHATSSFFVNGSMYPLGSLVLNVFRDSSNAELDLSTASSSLFGSDRVIVSMRDIKKFYVDGDQVMSISDLYSFYQSYMAGAGIPSWNITEPFNVYDASSNLIITAANSSSYISQNVNISNSDNSAFYGTKGGRNGVSVNENTNQSINIFGGGSYLSFYDDASYNYIDLLFEGSDFLLVDSGSATASLNVGVLANFNLGGTSVSLSDYPAGAGDGSDYLYLDGHSTFVSGTLSTFSQGLVKANGNPAIFTYTFSCKSGYTSCVVENSDPSQCSKIGSSYDKTSGVVSVYVTTPLMGVNNLKFTIILVK